MSRLIETADAINALYELNNEHPFRNMKFSEVVNCISSLPPAKQWIPCSEKMPKAGEYIGYVEKYYLVQNEYGDILVARYTHSGYWEQKYQLKPHAFKVVAWMELPEAWKESEV